MKPIKDASLLLYGAASLALGLVPQTLAQTTPPKRETIGGGIVASPAAGPKPSFGIGGPTMVLVKNWRFGTNGTIKNYADMNANFLYHDQFGTYNNGGKYGANTVAPDLVDAVGGQPIEGVNSDPVRKFTADSLLTFLKPLDKAVKVQVWNHNTGNGSFMAKWRLPNGGSLLGHDIVWETRVRYVTPPYFWFSLWTAGNKWKWDGHNAQGAEQDLVESFGYDNGNNNTNYDGRFWHSNAVASPSKDDYNFWDWGGTMTARGLKSYDASQYHIWTWLYKKDNTYAMYVDGVRVQGGSHYFWTYGNTTGDEPIDMDFLFDGSWGHNQIGSVDKELPAAAFDGKFYEWQYSRVYLSAEGDIPRNGPHLLPGTVRGIDCNIGAKGIAYDQTVGGGWRKYTVLVPAGGRCQFRFRVASPLGSSTFHLEDEKGISLTKTLTAPKTAGSKSATVTASAPATLSSGTHILKWVQDSPGLKLLTFTAVKVPGPTAIFVKTDTTTQGNWKGVYGADGYLIAGDKTLQPNYGTLSKTGWTVTWNGSTSDVRAPQKADGGPADHVAGQWGANDPSYDIDCLLTAGVVHRVALYGLDWDKNGRSETIQVLDADTGGVLDTQDLNTYVNGKYLVWNVSGHVTFRVLNTSRWTNPALSGLFLDPAAGKSGSAKKLRP
jgi:hypothetical protein